VLTKYTLLGAALFAAHGPVLAQQAELLHFGGLRDDVVIHVGSPRPEIEPAVIEDPADLSSVLAADFGLIGASPANFTPPPPSLIDVPLWMRTGVRSSSLMIASPSRPAVSPNCGPVDYRPRGDLPASTELRRAQLFPLIAAIACEHQIPVGLFDALIAQESRYQQNAISPKGAIGLSQLMPRTADYLGVTNHWDITENLRGGARYLREQLDEFGRYDLALAAYNAGPGRVRSNRRIPRIRETIDYVRNITAVWVATEQRGSLRGSTIAPRAPLVPQRTVVLANYTSPSVANPR